MRVIVYTRPDDGGLSVVIPAVDDEAKVWQRLPKDAVNPMWVEQAAIPSDRTFRNAWTLNGSAVQVDMPKARELHKDALRKLREPLLAALDVDYQIADEAKDQSAKDEIAAKKQVLRDVTEDPAIDSAKTPDALKAVLPDALVEKAV